MADFIGPHRLQGYSGGPEGRGVLDLRTGEITMAQLDDADDPVLHPLGEDRFLLSGEGYRAVMEWNP